MCELLRECSHELDVVVIECDSDRKMKSERADDSIINDEWNRRRRTFADNLVNSIELRISDSAIGEVVQDDRLSRPDCVSQWQVSVDRKLPESVYEVLGVTGTRNYFNLIRISSAHANDSSACIQCSSTISENYAREMLESDRPR